MSNMRWLELRYILLMQIRMFIIRFTMNRDVPKPSESSLSPNTEMAPGSRPRVDVVVLMAGRRDVVLVHGAEEYLLRITNQGKLILTK